MNTSVQKSVCSRQFMLRLQPELHEAIEARARRERRTIAALIRNALSDRFLTEATPAHEEGA